MRSVRRAGAGTWRFVRAALAAAAAMAALWLTGLLWFVSLVPAAPSSESAAAEERTDAIVVLTGGSERLEVGLRLLAEGRAGKLFVSGAARGVDAAALLRVAGRPNSGLACCIAIGYAADNTAGNARETGAWMRAQGFSSLRLVTANYHMPRSLLEFRRAMPGFRIVPHPVYPPQFKRARWWLWPGTAQLMISEFNKYLLAHVRLPGGAPATP